MNFIRRSKSKIKNTYMEKNLEISYFALNDHTNNDEMYR